MRVIFLGGVNGAGKTSLVGALGPRDGLRVLHGTTLLMDHLGIPRNYEALWALPTDRVEAAFTEVFRDLQAAEDSRCAIVTGHYVRVLGGRIEPSFGSWYGFSTELVLVTSRASDLLRRVLVDEARGTRTGRNLFGSAPFTTDEQAAFLARAQQCSADVMQRAGVEFNRRCYTISNNNGQLHVALGKLMDIIMGEALQ